MWLSKKVHSGLVSKEDALVGRGEVIDPPEADLIFNHSMVDVPSGYTQILVAMGCFWGAERRFWLQDNVYSTAAGYAGGYTLNPHYKEVCSGQTAHTEVVKVVYKDDASVLAQLLTTFWESHDPTQGMRQGNDTGSQYRSAIYVFNDEQMQAVVTSKQAYQTRLNETGLGEITTEIAKDVTFYFAEEYHQQYLHKNPQGYCGLRGTGVSCT